MIPKPSARPVRLAVLLAAICAIGLSAVAAAPATAATPQLALGADYSCMMLADNTVKCWGRNQNGQLGNGLTTNSHIATYVKKPFGPTTFNATYSQISADFYSTCGVTSAGVPECWGDNSLGQLGLGSTTQAYRVAPAAVTGITSGATQIDGGLLLNCAVVSGGVKCWGHNDYGQLGNGTVNDSSSPVTVSGLSGVSSVISRGNFVCALLSNGTVKCWGRNLYGQLGNGTTNTGNTVGGAGATSTPVSVLNLSGATQLSAGLAFACALINDGTVKCWGLNESGQLGDGTTTSRSAPVTVQNLSGVTQITSGQNFTCALINDGKVKCWGFSSEVVGSGIVNSPVAVSGLSDVTQVAAGYFHACALAGGEVKCWGRNSFGELGIAPATTSSSTPVTLSGVLPPPPAAPVLSGVPSNPTSQITASIGFTSTTAGATFLCSVDGGAFSACTSPKSMTGLSEGSHSIAVKAVKDGVESTATTASWVVDTTPPAAPTLSGVPSDPTAATHAVIHFHSAGDGVTYQCSVDGAAYVDCSSPLELSGLGDGAHSVSVKAIDAAGNTSTVATASWAVDTTAHTPPYVSLISPDISPANLTTASVEYDGEPGVTFLCSLDGGAYEPCPPAPVTLSGLSDGTHTYSVKQVDGVGNASDPTTVTWEVDTTPPAAPSLSGLPSGSTSATSTSATFSGEPGATFECKLDGGAWAACTSPRALSGLALGSHTFSVRAKDAAGNVGSVSSRTWSVVPASLPCSGVNTPTPPTPTGTVSVTAGANFRWTLGVSSKFNTGGDTRGCAQLLTVQISTATRKPANDQPGPIAPSYAKGIVAWTGGGVSRASRVKPTWVRVENRIGRWSGWVQVK